MDSACAHIDFQRLDPLPELIHKLQRLCHVDRQQAKLLAAYPRQQIAAPQGLLQFMRHQLQHRCEVLQDCGGLADDEIKTLLDAETWLNAEEAVAKGFADELQPALKAVATTDMDRLPEGLRRLAQLWEEPSCMTN